MALAATRPVICPPQSRIAGIYFHGHDKPFSLLGPFGDADAVDAVAAEGNAADAPARPAINARCLADKAAKVVLGGFNYFVVLTLGMPFTHYSRGVGVCTLCFRGRI